MTLLLWILAYLAVGFGVAVVVVRVTKESWMVEGVWSLWSVGAWPILLLPFLLGSAIKAVARRLPR